MKRLSLDELKVQKKHSVKLEAIQGGLEYYTIFGERGNGGLPTLYGEDIKTYFYLYSDQGTSCGVAVVSGMLC